MKQLSEDYEVLFSGEVYRGADRVVVKRNLALLFNEDPGKIEQLFTGRTVVLKNGLSKKAAERYQVALAKAGAVCKIRDRNRPFEGGRARFNVGGESKEFTLREVSVHRVVCPRCNYQQLETDLCVRCGANIDQAAREKLKQDRIKERRGQGVARPKSISVRPRRVVIEQSHFYGPADNAVYLGFGQRFLAFLVDAAVIAVLLGAIIAGLTAVFMPQGLSAESLLQVFAGDAQASEISWTMELFPTVFVLLFWFAISSTPGKLAVRGAIRDERTLGDPEWWQLLVRYLGYIPSALCLGMGFFWIIWDEKHQGWHDKLARTVVVETE